MNECIDSLFACALPNLKYTIKIDILGGLYLDITSVYKIKKNIYNQGS